jgi:hypothetical protein
LLIWGDSTAGALMPGLFKAQQTHEFGLAQLTASSCVPILNADIEVTPGCRGNNDRVLALMRQLKPDVILLHGTCGVSTGPDIEKTVAVLRQQTGARVVVLGPIVVWRRGLPNEVMRHYLLHRELIPARSQAGQWMKDIDTELRGAATAGGGEFISAADVLCNEQGCLTRLGDEASDITASDQVHLTEKASAFLVQGIIDRVLGTSAPRTSASQ